MFINVQINHISYIYGWHSPVWKFATISVQLLWTLEAYISHNIRGMFLKFFVINYDILLKLLRPKQ